MPAQQEHLPALTGLRAFAAVWVMLLHLQHGIGLKGHVLLGPLVNHGFWAVDIFFVLSGFILSLIYAPRFERGLDGREYWTYLSARFARIYPLHAFALAALGAYYLGGWALADRTLPPGFSLGNLALNLSLLHGWGLADRLSWNYPSWSIGTEWFAYLVMLPLLARGLRRAAAITAVLAAAALWTAVYGLVHATGETVGSQSVDWGLPRIAAEFTLGYALYRLYPSLRIGRRASDALVIGALLAIGALALAPAALEWLLAPAIAALIAGLVRPGTLGRAVFANRTAVFWGERSYSIYMLHAVVQIYCSIALQHLGLTALSAGAAWALAAAQVVGVLVASHLVYGHVELPLRTRLRGVLAPHARVAAGESRPDAAAP